MSCPAAATILTAALLHRYQARTGAGQQVRVLPNWPRPAPDGLALSRQNLPVFSRGIGDASGDTLASAAGAVRGAYILADAPCEHPDVILIATGSEVQLALQARGRLAAEGIGARVVSAPCLEWFVEQDTSYRESVLPASVAARVLGGGRARVALAGHHRRQRPRRVHRTVRGVRRLRDPLSGVGGYPRHRGKRRP